MANADHAIIVNMTAPLLLGHLDHLCDHHACALLAIMVICLFQHFPLAVAMGCQQRLSLVGGVRSWDQSCSLQQARKSASEGWN